MKFAWMFAFFLLAAPARAADIQRSISDGTNVITIAGVINKGDEVTFRELAATSTGDTIIVLNSEGGLVQPALEIGRAIRLKGAWLPLSPQTRFVRRPVR